MRSCTPNELKEIIANAVVSTFQIVVLYTMLFDLPLRIIVVSTFQTTVFHTYFVLYICRKFIVSTFQNGVLHNCYPLGKADTTYCINLSKWGLYAYLVLSCST